MMMKYHLYRINCYILILLDIISNIVSNKKLSCLPFPCSVLCVSICYLYVFVLFLVGANVASVSEFFILDFLVWFF
jgi:hypothetical protein